MQNYSKIKNTSLILLIILLLINPIQASAEDNDSEAFEVIMETSQKTPATGIPWTLTLLVNYPSPDDVDITAPLFPGILFQERLIKIPKIKGEQVWTSFEYKFIPTGRGRVIIEPFTITCPLGIIETEPVILTIISTEEEKTITPKIVWENAPARMVQGEKAAIAIRVTNWDKRLPGQEFFMPEVPQGVILELSQLEEKERNNGLAIRLTLVPLIAGNFLLPARTLYHENVIFEIPPLQINIAGFIHENPHKETPEPHLTGQEDNAHDISANDVYLIKLSFPEFDFTALNKSIVKKASKAQYENIYAETRSLWDEGAYALSLAKLRQNERDLPNGALLQPLRREAEERLGFFNTENENHNKRNILINLSIVTVILSLFVCFVFFKGFSLKKAVLLPLIVIFVVSVVFCLYWLFTDHKLGGAQRLGNTQLEHSKSSENCRSGVMLETPVRRAADYAADELFVFKEGQPVIILQNSGEWVMVRANETAGRMGWIPAGAVIFY